MRRLYSLFARERGERRWHRIAMGAYARDAAVRYWQGVLLDYSLTSSRFEVRLLPANNRVFEQDYLDNMTKVTN